MKIEAKPLVSIILITRFIDRGRHLLSQMSGLSQHRTHLHKLRIGYTRDIFRPVVA